MKRYFYLVIRPNTNRAMPTLLDLPTELHLLIAAFLSAPELQLLRLTTTYFYSILPPPSLSALNAISISVYNHRLHTACGSCLQLHSGARWKRVERSCSVSSPAVAYAYDEGGLNYGGYEVKKYVDVCLRSGWERSQLLPYLTMRQLRERDEERVRLRKLRERQGLGNAVWDRFGPLKERSD